MSGFNAFSVCMSVYKNDNAENFLTALRSVANQTIVPNEIVLVVDGPIGNCLESTIATFRKEYANLVVVRFKENQGHAAARQAGIENAQYPLIAVMDSDDIALPTRFEKQIKYFLLNPNVDVVGGQISEFIGDMANVVGRRIVPQTDKEIKNYLKKRCPFNQVSVMFRKESVLRCGGYIDWHYNEDYFLWIRMVQHGCVFANLPDVLVDVRVGEEMYARRGGVKYFRSEARLQKYMLNNKMISHVRYAYNVMIRLFLQVLFPNWLRGWVFQRFAREKNYEKKI